MDGVDDRIDYAYDVEVNDDDATLLLELGVCFYPIYYTIIVKYMIYNN